MWKAIYSFEYIKLEQCIPVLPEICIREVKIYSWMLLILIAKAHETWCKLWTIIGWILCSMATYMKSYLSIRVHKIGAMHTSSNRNMHLRSNNLFLAKRYIRTCYSVKIVRSNVYIRIRPYLTILPDLFRVPFYVTSIFLYTYVLWYLDVLNSFLKFSKIKKLALIYRESFESWRSYIETLKNKNNNNHFSKLALIYRDGFFEKFQ
jgi:hypothetical protein